MVMSRAASCPARRRAATAYPANRAREDSSSTKCTEGSASAASRPASTAAEKSPRCSMTSTPRSRSSCFFHSRASADMCTVVASPSSAATTPMDSPRFPVEPTEIPCPDRIRRTRSGSSTSSRPMSGPSAPSDPSGASGPPRPTAGWRAGYAPSVVREPTVGPRRPSARRMSSATCSTSWIPPRALIEPLTGRASSRLTHSCPGSSVPVSSPSSACSAGARSSGDSRIPPVGRVAGNRSANQGAKRVKRARASSTRPSGRPASASTWADGARSSRSQVVSAPAASRATSGSWRSTENALTDRRPAPRRRPAARPRRAAPHAGRRGRSHCRAR